MSAGILIEKSGRMLTAEDPQGTVLLRCRIALGKQPEGHKRREGDGRTPEGNYYICLKRKEGRYGPALGLSYPSAGDAAGACRDGSLDPSLLPLFEEAERLRKRPPWGTPLGGEIYLHGGGSERDWTAGCIALNDDDMAVLFELCDVGDQVRIIP